MKRVRNTHLATGMKRMPIRILAGFSNSGPSFRLRPISNTLCAQDIDGFFEDEAAAGASVAISVGTPFGGEVLAAGATTRPVTGTKGGGSDANGILPSAMA